MDNIQKICLEKAIIFLKAAKADYVITCQGEVFQSEELEAKQQEVKKRHEVNNFVESTSYTHILHVLAVGETARFRRGAYAILEDEKAWQSFIASVKSLCRRKYGEGNYVIVKTNDHIEILRAK